MKPPRHNEPQFDLPVISSEFNLRAEQGTDFDRIARERQQVESDRAEAEQRQQRLDDVFGDPNSVYTRRQAIEDGVLVDLMQPDTVKAVREAGFKYPVAMTIGAFSATICEIGKPLPEGQDIDGRLWDVLWMLSLAVKGSRERSDRVFLRC